MAKSIKINDEVLDLGHFTRCPINLLEEVAMGNIVPNDLGAQRMALDLLAARKAIDILADILKQSKTST